MKILNNIKVMFLVGTLSLGLAACKKSDNIEDVNGNAVLRLSNSFEGSVAQDFYQGNTKLNSSTVAYGSAPIKVTAVGNAASALSFTNTGTTTVSATITTTLSANATYTVFYNKKADGSAEVYGIQEDNSAPASGKAKVRFINLGSTLLGALDISMAGGANLATGLGLKSTTAYQTIDPGVNINVNVIGGATSSISGSNFQAGKNYTVWFNNSLTTTAMAHVVVQD